MQTDDELLAGKIIFFFQKIRILCFLTLFLFSLYFCVLVGPSSFGLADCLLFYLLLFVFSPVPVVAYSYYCFVQNTNGSSFSFHASGPNSGIFYDLYGSTGSTVGTLTNYGKLLLNGSSSAINLEISVINHEQVTVLGSLVLPSGNQGKYQYHQLAGRTDISECSNLGADIFKISDGNLVGGYHPRGLVDIVQYITNLNLEGGTYYPGGFGDFASTSIQTYIQGWDGVLVMRVRNEIDHDSLTFSTDRLQGLLQLQFLGEMKEDDVMVTLIEVRKCCNVL